MGFFDTLGETLASTSKVVGSKTKEMAGTTKLSLQISQEEAKLKKAYEALGEAYFKNHENDMPEPYAVYAADIRECAARLESLTKDKQILKNQKRCASCGAWMPNEDRFCGKCGAENEILTKETESGESEEAEDSEV
ncbi:MAG: zinc ribbon domain-containing protein [Lachnospiraceae bacterium]|nr:zinc ribbon domain-containing protein [Lachnospiraceae bacterium]